MDPRLLQYINNYLFGRGEQKLTTVDLERFAELFVFCTRGTVDEKVKVLLTSLGKSDEECGDIPYSLVKEVRNSSIFFTCPLKNVIILVCGKYSEFFYENTENKQFETVQKLGRQRLYGSHSEFSEDG